MIKNRIVKSNLICLIIGLTVSSGFVCGAMETVAPVTVPVRKDSTAIRIQPIEDQEPPSNSNRISPGIVESYCYPNPAVGGAAPVIHAKGVGLETLEVKLYDTSGHLVEKGVLSPRGAGGGDETIYEFEWSGPIASGIYFGLVQAKSNDAAFRSHLKIAVIR